MPPVSITEFYTRHAELYDAICADRDFEMQVSAILQMFSPGEKPRRALELFAGPAYHTGILQWTHGIDTFCVDASPAMREVALAQGRCQAAQYVLGRIPEALNELPGRFDLVLAPRYSLGYLDRQQLRATLATLSRVLQPGGLFIAELHQIQLLVSGLDQLGIRCREARLGRLRARCWWPDAGLAWSETDWKVRMDVRVRWEDNAGDVTDEQHFVSEEQLYSRDELIDLAKATGGFEAEPLTARHLEAFPGTSLVVLRRRGHV
ncbi:methyltransferase domain-containing protein [Myxococcus sp. 1LA]